MAARERQGAAHARRYAQPVTSDPSQLSLDDARRCRRPPPRSATAGAPAALSVTSLVSYRRCPKQFYWSVVRPLPRRSSAAARLGTEVHRWIELRSGRQLALIEPEDELDGSTPRCSPSTRRRPPPSSRSRSSRRPSRISTRDGSRRRSCSRGRRSSSAAASTRCTTRDGRTELVDFKTGRAPAEGDPAAELQLDLYAIAAVDTWGDDPANLRTTYCYLSAGDQPVLASTEWTPERLDQVRDELRAGRQPGR